MWSSIALLAIIAVALPTVRGGDICSEECAIAMLECVPHYFENEREAPPTDEELNNAQKYCFRMLQAINPRVHKPRTVRTSCACVIMLICLGRT
jgi:hypothetical protein